MTTIQQGYWPPAWKMQIEKCWVVLVPSLKLEAARAGMDDHHIGYPLLWSASFLQAVDAVLQSSKLIWIDQDKIMQVNKHNIHANMYFKEYKHISTLLTMSRLCGHSAEQSICYIVSNQAFEFSALINPCYFSGWVSKGGIFLDFHWGLQLNLSESVKSAP